MTADAIYQELYLVHALRQRLLRLYRARAAAAAALAERVDATRAVKLEELNERVNLAEQALISRAQDRSLSDALAWAEYIEALGEGWNGARHTLASVEAGCAATRALPYPNADENPDVLSMSRENFRALEQKLIQELRG